MIGPCYLHTTLPPLPTSPFLTVTCFHILDSERSPYHLRSIVTPLCYNSLITPLKLLMCWCLQYATSIMVCGGYEDDTDDGHELIYTGTAQCLLPAHCARSQLPCVAFGLTIGCLSTHLCHLSAAPCCLLGPDHGCLLIPSSLVVGSRAT